MRRRNSFTLLEVVIALLILSIGVFLLLEQLAVASRRVFDAAEGWERSHELVNAAEYALLAGPEAKAERRFRNPDRFRIRYEYLPFDPPEGFLMPVVGMRLSTLVVHLEDLRGTPLGTLEVDCWREGEDHAPSE